MPGIARFEACCPLYTDAMKLQFKMESTHPNRCALCRSSKPAKPANENNESKEEESMNVIKVNDSTFEQEVLNSNIPVLIDFYADWCGPCKMLSPTVDEVAEENDDIKVVKVNVDESQEIAVKYQVMSIPTLVVIKNGNEINRSVGVIDKEEILSMIK